MKVEITFEETWRACKEFEVTNEELKRLNNGDIPERIMDVLNSDKSPIEDDWAVNDMSGRTIVDWN